MKRLSAADFSLMATLESGQLFRYHKSNDCFYYVVVGNSILKLQQQGKIVKYSCSNSSFNIKKFLGLSHNYGEIIKSISKDGKIAAAIKHHFGLRLLEQDVWECAASFICSSFSNIPRIRQCLEKVAAAFGSRVSRGGYSAFSFPQPQQISDFARLKQCGLGYRAKYLLETAAVFASHRAKYSRQQLRKLGYAEAKKRLMELPGVGSKVADCILLFSCQFYEAFPVDVWILRAMQRLYGKQIAAAARKADEKSVAEFARSYFGSYCGYAQQFLYHYARTESTPRNRKV